MELKKEPSVDLKERAQELVLTFIQSAFTNRELLVSLIERIELTENKEIIIKLRFCEPETVS